MEEKIRLDLGTQEETFEFAGTKITVCPIDFPTQVRLISEYLGELLFPDGDSKVVAFTQRDRFGAVMALRLAVIDTCTNIAVLGENGEALIDVDKVVASGLWDALEEHIPNYYDFETMLVRIEADIREERIIKESVGAVLNKVADSIVKALETLANADVSDENITRIENMVENLKEGIQASPVAGLFKEAG